MTSSGTSVVYYNHLFVDYILSLKDIFMTI